LIALIDSIINALFQSIALIKSLYAVLGWPGVIFLYIELLILIIIPILLYYYILIDIPKIWIKSNRGYIVKLLCSLFDLIIVASIAGAISQGMGYGISWIADRNPCASLAAGVTGKIIPKNCPAN